MKKYLLILFSVFAFGQSGLIARQNFGHRQANNANMISYWQMENNGNDSDGSNDGTGVALTYGTGLVGQAAIFNGSNAYFSVPDADNLSFTNGTNDLPFSISLIANFTATGDRWIFNKRGATSGTDEYQIMLFGGLLYFVLFNYNNNAAYIQKTISFTPTLNQNYLLAFTYNGSGSHTGLSIYIDGVSVGTSSTGGTYTRMNNGTSPVIIGRSGWNTSLFFFSGKLDEIVIWNTALNSTQVTDINIILQSGNHL